MALIKFPAKQLVDEVKALCIKNKYEYGQIRIEDGLAVLESDKLKYESFDELESYLWKNAIPFDRFSEGTDFKDTVEGVQCFRPDEGNGEYNAFVRTYGGHVMVRAAEILRILEMKEPNAALVDAIKAYLISEGHQCKAINTYM